MRMDQDRGPPAWHLPLRSFGEVAMMRKRTLGIAAGAGAAAALLFWALVARPRKRRRAEAARDREAATAPSAWGGAAVLR
jgi:hypothetical protein